MGYAKKWTRSIMITMDGIGPEPVTFGEAQ